MKILPAILMVRLVFVGFGLLGLTACDPFEKQRAEQAEKTRIECLDKICPGDAEPKHDTANEVVLKLNGQWYIGPKEYFSNDGHAGFEWWDHKPISSRMKRPPEMQALAVAGKGYDFSIEIFLSSKPEVPVARSTYQRLMKEESQGHVTEKRKLRDGLEVWRTREGSIEETWYIAIDLKDPSGDPAVAACRGADPAKGRCNMGFLWQPNVAAGMRFRATHGPDWPEIFLETTRVLQFLRKA